MGNPKELEHRSDSTKALREAVQGLRGTPSKALRKEAARHEAEKLTLNRLAKELVCIFMYVCNCIPAEDVCKNIFHEKLVIFSSFCC